MLRGKPRSPARAVPPKSQLLVNLSSLRVHRHHSWSTQHLLDLHLLRILEQVFEEKKRIDDENRAASKKRSLNPQEQPFPTQDKPPLP